MRVKHRALCLVVLVGLFASGAACTSSTSPDLPAGATRVTGIVRFYTIEGGFWAVRGDDGVVYDPMNGLAPAFQQENLRVTMVVRIRTDLSGIHMVGPIVEIIEIQKG